LIDALSFRDDIVALPEMVRRVSGSAGSLNEYQVQVQPLNRSE
jgi:hypothetical protein